MAFYRTTGQLGKYPVFSPWITCFLLSSKIFITVSKAFNHLWHMFHKPASFWKKMLMNSRIMLKSFSMNNTKNAPVIDVSLNGDNFSIAI